MQTGRNTVPGTPRPEDFFRVGQSPGAWLATAEKLAEAAETIAANQAKLKQGYQDACEVAAKESEASESGVAEIRHVEPNYLPAGLLYGFAIENALKGLIIANQPDILSASRIDPQIASHDLIALATSAGLTLSDDERKVLGLMSIIVEWAGRYPVAKTVVKHQRLGPMPVVSSGVLDWLRWQEVIRMFFKRAQTGLKNAVGETPVSFGVVVTLRD
jgi:hypothetical protein